MSYDANLDYKLEQYRKVAQRINMLFDVLSHKLGGAWQSDGIGSCGDNPEDYGYGATEEFADILPLHWAQALDDIDTGLKLGGFNGHAACRYHGKDHGCILGDVKPATCLSYVEQPDSSIRAVLGIERKALEVKLKNALRSAMTQRCENDDTAVVIIELDSFIHQAQQYAHE